MREYLSYVGWFFGILLLVVILSQVGNAVGLWNIQFWGVKKEDAKREVFEQTQSYVESKRQDLLKLYTEYNKAETDQERAAIKYVVQEQFANVDDTKFEGRLYDFLIRMKYE